MEVPLCPSSNHTTSTVFPNPLRLSFSFFLCLHLPPVESEQPPILQGRFWELYTQVPLHHKGERREADQQQQRIDVKKQKTGSAERKDSS
jgi:hypothetical protein